MSLQAGPKQRTERHSLRHDRMQKARGVKQAARKGRRVADEEAIRRGFEDIQLGLEQVGEEQ